MANYDRRILIPYLQDLCSLEMMCKKLEEDIRQCHDEERKYRQLADVQHIPAPKKEESKAKGDAIGGIVGCIVLCVAHILVGLFAFFVIGAKYPVWKNIGIAAFILGALWVVFGIVMARSEMKAAEDKYETEMYEYKAKCEKARGYAEKSMEIARAKNNLTSKMARIEKLRDEVYSVDIIPRQYRNIYAAYYLYDFMSTSRETDLEKVIQTFVLEEIKQRLDRIIQQNNQMLINQRVQLAMQEKQNRMQADNHREEMRNIARLEANQERQLDYQKMITANQEVTNYILAEDYFRKYDKRIPY